MCDSRLSFRLPPEPFIPFREEHMQPKTVTKTTWIAFSAALAAAMMDLLDATIASVAGPAMRADLGGSYADLQWITAAYTLAMAVGLLTGGRLGDMFGRRRMLLIGAGGFTIASLLCAAAPTAELLIGSRALQGALGAVMLPQVFGLIRDLFPPDQMGKAWGVLGPVSGLSAVLGPIVAGLLIDADLFGTGWRSIFLVNLPVGAFVLIVGRRYLPAGAPAERARRLDLTGMTLAGAGAVLLVYPLVQGREQGWPLWIVAMLVAALPVLAAFGRHQARRKRSGATTLVEPSVFRNRSYVSGAGFAMVFLGAMGGLMLALTAVMQIGLDYTPIEASLTSAPYALGGFVGSAIGGMTMAKLGRTVLQAGLVVKGAGVVALYVVLEQAGTGVGHFHFTAPLLVAGIGMGMVFVPLFDIILAGVADHEVGSASGILQALQQLGMSLGVAGLGTLFFGLLGSHVDRAADFMAASGPTILVTVALLAAAFAIGFLLPRHARAHEVAPAA
jgi:EmrB/QacA subfamily drug resistance transporter